MEISQIFGYSGAVLIGVILGLVGGGGSILTVPILVYAMGIEPVLAMAYSLFVVGTTSLVGTIRNAQKQMIDFKIGAIFAVPAFLAVYVTRAFILPAIPDIIYSIGDFILSKDLALMVLFAIIMLLASYSMIKGRKETTSRKDQTTFNFPLIVLEGAVVGILTGLVGAGGGFLIIPALVVLAKIPMKRAVATSLFIISVKSLIGFIGDVQNLIIDWKFLLIFSSISIIGIFIGISLNQFISGKKLKKGFGWFVLVMGLWIILRETILK